MKIRKFIGVLAGVACLAVTVWAVEPVRWVVAAPGGTSTYSLSSRPVLLKSVEVFSATATTGTVTITQGCAGLTNAVTAVTLSSSAGSSTNLAVWVFPGDVLAVAYTVGATSGVVRFMGEMTP